MPFELWEELRSGRNRREKMSALSISIKAVLLFGVMLVVVAGGALWLGFGSAEAGQAGCIGAMPQSCVFTIL